ncbi:protein adenylyltransferase SelO [Lacimicrobium sp. SS2-24]|uniref:protein adenylyltransferase SelO n=1 Tax=Lacimicrobium sp. SS2-24 TaxID=2005569 RepID=UPI000B4AD1C5|nr:YdiU family protein [Lacimicrobium sp. SS2-24]
MSDITLPLQYSYIEALPEGCIEWQPDAITTPELVYLNRPLAKQLGLELASVDDNTLAPFFAGNGLPETIKPFAQAYTGHQFGHLAPMLGDGRAVILGEWLDSNENRWDIALKGSGRTPFSRGGDGKAALGPMLREVLLSEALYHLGIATTRSLAVVATNEPVQRQQLLPGAILTRLAASHIRIGTFEYFATRNDVTNLKALADYTLNRHYPELAQQQSPYLAMLEAVMQKQARLVASWINCGFIHGVMNTDNILLSGETVDFGPCAFIEQYKPGAVFSSIDQHGRYAYANQPKIMHWNLARFAETLLPLLDGEDSQKVEVLTDTINRFPDRYRQQLISGQRQKLGLFFSEEDGDTELVSQWLDLLHQNKMDFTQAWRNLSRVLRGDDTPLLEQVKEPSQLTDWLARWHQRLERDASHTSSLTDSQRAEKMEQVNPFIIARNHQVEAALTAASDNNDYHLFNDLLSALQQPFAENETTRPFATPAPEEFTERYQTFCGT